MVLAIWDRFPQLLAFSLSVDIVVFEAEEATERVASLHLDAMRLVDLHAIVELVLVLQSPPRVAGCTGVGVDRDQTVAGFHPLADFVDQDIPADAEQTLLHGAIATAIFDYIFLFDGKALVVAQIKRFNTPSACLAVRVVIAPDDSTRIAETLSAQVVEEKSLGALLAHILAHFEDPAAGIVVLP